MATVIGGGGPTQEPPSSAHATSTFVQSSARPQILGSQLEDLPLKPALGQHLSLLFSFSLGKRCSAPTFPLSSLLPYGISTVLGSLRNAGQQRAVPDLEGLSVHFAGVPPFLPAH